LNQGFFIVLPALRIYALFVALKPPGANSIKFVTDVIHKRSTLGEAAIQVN
jgi:hypothetical protein